MIPENLKRAKLGVIGLGYVGLPLAAEFGKKRPVVGFDVNQKRISELRSGVDSTKELSTEELRLANQLMFSADPHDLRDCTIYIVAVPTPIDKYFRPDLTLLLKASETVGSFLKVGDIVVYESTVYPGCTEEDCVPILEKFSDLKFNKDFFVGYSPERINPGDKQHRLRMIKKVTSGSTPAVADLLESLYGEIIEAGTHKASSIRVAEAAKVIENTQRDVNIALMNELSLIFCKLGIDTLEVLETAGTKWNFLPFRPGLVGGHCIGVDPYYLTHKAQEVGYHPEVILAGRRINDLMGDYIADTVIKLMLRKSIDVIGSKILILGFSFKENCPDIRNSKVLDIVEGLSAYSVKVDVYDPWIVPEEAEALYGITCLRGAPSEGHYAAVILAVAHREFIELGREGVAALALENSVIFDVKGVLPAGVADGRL